MAIELPDDYKIDVGSFTSNQQIELEEMLNADFGRIFSCLASEEQFIDDDGNRVRKGRVMRAVMYAALKGDYPDITLEEAGSIPLSTMAQMSPGDSEPEADETP